MTFKDLKITSYLKLQGLNSDKINRLDILRNKPFWIWDNFMLHIILGIPLRLVTVKHNS